MIPTYLISTQTICSHYNIEVSFVDALNDIGLVQIEIIEDNQFIHQDQITNLEKIIRLHDELNLNLEGIDVVLNLLEKVNELHSTVMALENKLKLYEE